MRSRSKCSSSSGRCGSPAHRGSPARRTPRGSAAATAGAQQPLVNLLAPRILHQPDSTKHASSVRPPGWSHAALLHCRRRTNFKGPAFQNISGTDSFGQPQPELQQQAQQPQPLPPRGGVASAGPARAATASFGPPAAPSKRKRREPEGEDAQENHRPRRVALSLQCLWCACSHAVLLHCRRQGCSDSPASRPVQEEAGAEAWPGRTPGRCWAAAARQRARWTPLCV